MYVKKGNDEYLIEDSGWFIEGTGKHAWYFYCDYDDPNYDLNRLEGKNFIIRQYEDKIDSSTPCGKMIDEKTGVFPRCDEIIYLDED